MPRASFSNIQSYQHPSINQAFVQLDQPCINQVTINRYSLNHQSSDQSNTQSSITQQSIITANLSSIQIMSSRGFKYETRLSIYLGAIVLVLSVLPMGISYFVVSHNATETLVQTLSNGLKDKSVLISHNIDRFYLQHYK